MKDHMLALSLRVQRTARKYIAFGKQDLPYIADVIQRTGGKAKWHLSDFDDDNTRKEIARLLKSYNQFGEISPFDHRLIFSQT